MDASSVGKMENEFQQRQDGDNYCSVGAPLPSPLISLLQRRKGEPLRMRHLENLDPHKRTIRELKQQGRNCRRAVGPAATALSSTGQQVPRSSLSTSPAWKEAGEGERERAP